VIRIRPKLIFRSFDSQADSGWLCDDVGSTQVESILSLAGVGMGDAYSSLSIPVPFIANAEWCVACCSEEYCEPLQQSWRSGSLGEIGSFRLKAEASERRVRRFRRHGGGLAKAQRGETVQCVRFWAAQGGVLSLMPEGCGKQS
jgi:hypothetical protein